MAKLLIVYATTEGHTGKLARYLCDLLVDLGHEVQLAAAQDLYRSTNLAAYDAFIVGASVHEGKHQDSVSHFVKDNLEQLSRVPCAFFSVSLNAALDDFEHREETQGYLNEFLAETGFHPDRSALVAGALLNTEYDYFKRELMTYLTRRTVGKTNLEQDYDFTDYEQLETFVQEFLDDVVNVKP